MELLFSEENLIISQYTVTTSHNSQHNTASWSVQCSAPRRDVQCTYIDLCILLMLLHHKLEYLSFCISTLDSEHELSP